jgi:nucleoid-associated protein YgaU
MQIWLKQGKESLRLPVLPSNFGVGLSQQNTTVNIGSLGEVNLMGKRGLKTLPLSSFFPAKEYGCVQYKGFPKPYECVKLIESWMDNPIQITITGTNINWSATIEKFNYSEQDGTGDVYYTIELKEYRKPSSMNIKMTVNKKSTKIMLTSTKRQTKPVKTTNYTVKAGDTLFDIAKKITGNSANCYAIANQNNISNPNSIKAGQKLVIKV